MKYLEMISTPTELVNVLNNYSFKAVKVNDVNDDSNQIHLDDKESKIIKEVLEEKYYHVQACIHHIHGSFQLHEDSMFMRDGKLKYAYCIIDKIDYNTSFSNTEDGCFSPVFFNGSKLTDSIELRAGNMFKFNPRKLHGLMSNCKIKMYVIWF